MDVIVVPTSDLEEAAYHAGLIAAVDGLPFAAPDGPLTRFYQAGWDEGMRAAQAWSAEATG